MTAIDDKWSSLGGVAGLGDPTCEELFCPDGIGRFRHYRLGSIYWSPQTGAHEVHGDIRRHYLRLGGPGSYLRYPTSDETSEGTNRFNAFTGGWIYWQPQCGAVDAGHRVHGGRTFYGFEPTATQLRQWTAASPTTYLYRRNVVENAFIENELGLKMPAAAGRYCSGGFPEGVGGWCSELAHFILLMNKGGVHNIKGLGGDLGDAYTVGEFENVFSWNHLWVPREKISRFTIEPGDYLAVSNGNHSTIVVGVKWDRTRLWTVERMNCGPDNDYVGFNGYDYIRPDGSVESQFYGVGKLHCGIVDASACVVQPIALPGPSGHGSQLQPGELLRPGQMLTSPNGRYSFVYQTDGNLVLYRNSDREARWSSETNGNPAGCVTMQTDGDLVVYDTVLNPLWLSGTWSAGSRLQVQDDGNVVIYGPDGAPRWATDTDE